MVFLIKLDDIKRHHRYPFADFVTNDLSLLMLEMYWAELIGSILIKAGNETSALGWLPAVPADRLEGNPILQIIDRGTVPPRQLRIIQKFNSTDAPAFDLATLAKLRYTDEVYVPYSPSLTYEGLDEDGETPIEELVIFSDISDPCERLHRQFVTKWCIDRVSVPSMHEMVAEYWKLIQANLIEVPPL